VAERPRAILEECCLSHIPRPAALRAPSRPADAGQWPSIGRVQASYRSPGEKPPDAKVIPVAGVAPLGALCYAAGASKAAVVMMGILPPIAFRRSLTRPAPSIRSSSPIISVNGPDRIFTFWPGFKPLSK